MIIGTGWTGLTAAREIRDFGFNVLLVQGNEQEGEQEGSQLFHSAWSAKEHELQEAYAEFCQKEGIRFLPRARLTGCRGTIGSFTLRLETGDQVWEENVGAVVLACETRASPLLQSYGLEDAPNAISLSGLEKGLTSQTNGEDSLFLLQQGGQAAFISGFAQEGDHLNQRRILSSLQTLEEQGWWTFVYTRNLKVADDGLEELAQTDRQLGAIFFKLDECPDISPDGSQIRHKDPVLEREVLMQPDLIVVEEKLLPGPENERLAQVLKITPRENGFLQEENIHRLPVRTNRKGIFSIGSSREIMTPAQTRSDAANAALALKEDFRELQENLFGERAFIDEDKCCVCLTCYRLCPHGAISLEDRPVISSLACQGCGLCASECPQEAISILETPGEEIKGSLAERIQAPDPGATPRIIAYCCQNSAYEAGMAAYVFNRDLPQGLKIVEVPCAGSISPDLILSDLREGVDGLLLLGCHPGACKSSKGNSFAQYNSHRLGSILEEVGLSRKRIRFRTLADNMDIEFSRYTKEMEESLVQLGQNPLARVPSAIRAS